MRCAGRERLNPFIQEVFENLILCQFLTEGFGKKQSILTKN